MDPDSGPIPGVKSRFFGPACQANSYTPAVAYRSRAFVCAGLSPLFDSLDAPPHFHNRLHHTTDRPVNPDLLSYYEAIEQASAEMLEAARSGRWDEVVKLEGACVLLICELKRAVHDNAELGPAQAQLKARIMQRVLVNDAKIRILAEPWLEDLDKLVAGRPTTLH